LFRERIAAEILSSGHLQPQGSRRTTRILVLTIRAGYAWRDRGTPFDGIEQIMATSLGL